MQRGHFTLFNFNRPLTSSFIAFLRRIAWTNGFPEGVLRQVFGPVSTPWPVKSPISNQQFAI